MPKTKDQITREVLLGWDPQEITSNEAAFDFMDQAIAYLGAGFHPDTRFGEYVQNGEPVFDAAEAARLDAAMERCFYALTDPYAIATELVELPPEDYPDEWAAFLKRVDEEGCPKCGSDDGGTNGLTVRRTETDVRDIYICDACGHEVVRPDAKS